MFWINFEGMREAELRVMYLPEDFQERAVTVEEVMRANFKDDTWPTAEVVILQMHALRGASMNWNSSPIVAQIPEAGICEKKSF